jgi:hypothetical protein
MAAKKAKKQVMVTVDEATLEALAVAAQALSAVALSIIEHADDPAVQKKLTKRFKR